jgi:uncharacterized protein YndB with AHSA1/START domain
VNTTNPTVSIEADPDLPIIRMTRDFAATPAQVLRAHTDPVLFARWVGPDRMDTEILDWDATSGGRWRYVARRDGNEYGFWGAVHDVQPNRMITQTFGFDGAEDSASLERVTFTDLGGGRTRLHGISVVFDVATRDAVLASGMERGVTEGYERLDDLLPGL